MSNNSPLNAINVFEVSARLGSFQKAAKELCVTPGAVSHQIKQLEDFIGKKLFKRKSRRVELTKIGRIYYAKVGASLDVLHRATQEVQSANDKEIIRIETPLTFAMHWLTPRMIDFQMRYPDVELRVSTSSDPIRVHRDIDLYLRRDPNQFSGLAANSFLTEYSVIVCSPRYLDQVRSWSNEKIYSLPLISMRSRQDIWPVWFREAKLNINSVENQIAFDNTILAIQAAIHGIGIALIPELFLKPFFENGSLISIPDASKIKTGTYYYLRSPFHRKKKASAFFNWLKKLELEDKKGLPDETRHDLCLTGTA